MSYNVLIDMRSWIQAELKKAELPGNDPFVYTSLRFCARQVSTGDACESAIKRLQEVAKKEHGMAYDAMRPHAALYMIDRALTTLT